MKKKITISVSEHMLPKIQKLKEDHGFRTMSATFHHILIVWDQSRQYKAFEKKKMKDAFWEAFEKDVKAHPEWYMEE